MKKQNKVKQSFKRKPKKTAEKKFMSVGYRKYKKFLIDNKITDERLINMVYQSLDNKDWYKNSYDTVKKYFGDNSELFIDILSATSPRTAVRANVIFALRAYSKIIAGYDVYKKGQTKYGIAHPIIEKNLRRISSGERLGGRKVSDFRKALLGDTTRVVVDIWMLRVFGLNKKAPCESDYNFIEYKVRKIARLLNMTATQVQACVWCSIKKQSTVKRLQSGQDFTDRLNELLNNNYRMDI